MITALGFLMVATFMVLIMTRRMTALVALILIPVLFGVVAGFAPKLGPMMLDGIKSLAPTGVMLMFAILYFGLMTDVGLFDPVVRRLVKAVHGDPMKVSLGTVALTAMIAMDGDGSTTYVIATAALLPLYDCLGMSRRRLCCLVMTTTGLINIIPWGGPTARAASALRLDASDLFTPMVPAMLAGIAFMFFVAWVFGRSERTRLGVVGADQLPDIDTLCAPSNPAIRRPKLFWVNALITVALLVCLVLAVVPLPILMMLAFSIAMIVNYPNLQDQKDRVATHAPNVLAVVSLIFAAGIFTGILNGTGMVEGMSRSVVALVPAPLGPYLAPITAALSLPFTFFISNDAFYYGVLPILAEAGAHYGITPAEIARASLIGQPFHQASPLVPATYLLVTLAGVDLADHQKTTLKWCVAVAVVMTLVAIATGAFPLFHLAAAPS